MLSCIIVSGSGSATPDEEDIVVGGYLEGTRSCQRHVLLENCEKKLKKKKTPRESKSKTTRRLTENRGNGIEYNIMLPAAVKITKQKCLRQYYYYYLPKLPDNEDTTEFGCINLIYYLLVYPTAIGSIPAAHSRIFARRVVGDGKSYNFFFYYTFSSMVKLRNKPTK